MKVPSPLNFISAYLTYVHVTQQRNEDRKVIGGIFNIRLHDALIYSVIHHISIMARMHSGELKFEIDFLCSSLIGIYGKCAFETLLQNP